MRPSSSVLLSIPVTLGVLLGACRNVGSGAGVGGNREGCGDPGSHSVELGEHSCVCEPGYEWCDDALDSFDCCPIEGEGETGEPEIGPEPEPPCDESRFETLACVESPEQPGPAAAQVWACNGEQWVHVPGYATFACSAEGFPFAYGCLPGPEFLCGFGPGSECDEASYASVCQDEDIIDTCVFGRRSVDRCSRLCSEIAAWGPGFTTGSCEQPMDDPAVCVCA